MNFLTYKQNVVDFLDHYYSDTKKTLKNLPVRHAQSLFENENLRLNNYVHGTFKEIEFDVLEEFEVRYGEEAADKLIEEYNRSLSTVRFNAVSLDGKQERQTRQKIDTSEKFNREAEEILRRHTGIKVRTGAAAGFAAGGLIGLLTEGLALGRVLMWAGSGAIVVAGATVLYYVFLDQHDQVSVVQTDKPKKSELKSPASDDQKKESGQISVEILSNLLDARRKKVEKELMAGIERAESTYQAIILREKAI
ncbi:hypothetical protein [Jeotgalibacillus proteolyticus]|uniref:hypothetical protein n=1 Tax=Jeotgalibacillus proteolyticus TaxID=2082395 RepID=UPI003CF7FC95